MNMQIDEIPDLGLPTEVEPVTLQPVDDAGGTVAASSTEESESPLGELALPVEPLVVFEDTNAFMRENHADKAFEELDEALCLPTVGYQTMVDVIDKRMDQLDIQETLETAQWALRVTQGVTAYNRDNSFQGAIDRTNADWTFGIKSQERKLGPIKTGAGPIRGTTPLTGITALAKATAFTTVGAIIRIPLPHSGIWVTIKAPSDGQLLELERRIASDRVEFGRMTSGRVFSQSDVILKSQLIALAVMQVVDSTYPDANVDLRTVIKLPDLPLLLGGLALSIYPNSFPLTRACLADPASCRHIQRGDVSIAKMMRYDNNHFTEKQRLFLARNQSRVTEKEIQDYLADFSAGNTDVADYNKDVFFTFRTPTLLEYQEMGSEWITSLEAGVDEAFGASITAKDRNDLINSKANSVAMRQYSHWVDRITYYKNEEADGTVTDRESIYETLERFSTNQAIADAFYKGVTNYMNAMTVGLIAIPSWVCPSCAKRQPEGEGAFRRLIPVDAATVFFTLLSHRVLSVHRRVGI